MEKQTDKMMTPADYQKVEPDWGELWRSGDVMSKPWVMKAYTRTRIKSYYEIFERFSLRNISILEIGAGTGLTSKYLAEKFNVKVTLLDSSDEAIRMYLQTSGDYASAYILDDVMTYEPEEKFDLAFSDGLIEHFIMPERGEIIKAHARLVKPDGYVLIHVPKSSWFVRNIFTLKDELELKYSLSQLEEELRDHGLEPLGHVEDWHMIGVLCRV